MIFTEQTGMPTLNEDVPEMDRKSTDKNDAALEATTNVEVGEILASGKESSLLHM